MVLNFFFNSKTQTFKFIDYLSHANLENAKLHGVRMACCNLESALLSGADFEDPTGKISNLEGANLKNANARMVRMEPKWPLFNKISFNNSQFLLYR